MFQTLSGLSPSVIPSTAPTLDSTFTSRSDTLSPPLASGLVVESLVASQSLQAASGLDRVGLLAVLSAPWSPETARASSKFSAANNYSSLR